QNRNNISAAAYTVTITDNNLCSVSLTVNIAQPLVLNISESHTNIFCNGTATGAIYITPAGGTAPYSYVWTDASTLQNRLNIAAGNYGVILSDQNLCSVSAN